MNNIVYASVSVEEEEEEEEEREKRWQIFSVWDDGIFFFLRTR